MKKKVEVKHRPHVQQSRSRSESDRDALLIGKLIDLTHEVRQLRTVFETVADRLLDCIDVRGGLGAVTAIKVRKV